MHYNVATPLTFCIYVSLDFCCQVFDTNNSGELDFTEFVRGLAMFTTKNVDRDKKLEFLFNIYDMDRDGFICNSELFEVEEKCHYKCILFRSLLLNYTT